MDKAKVPSHANALLVSSHLFSFHSIIESRLLSLDLSKEWHKSELLNLRESFPTITDAASQRTSFDIRESSVSFSACSLTMQAKFSSPWIFSIFGCKAIKVAHLTNLETFSLSWKNLKQNYLTNDLNIENQTHTKASDLQKTSTKDWWAQHMNSSGCLGLRISSQDLMIWISCYTYFRTHCPPNFWCKITIFQIKVTLERIYITRILKQNLH